MRFFGFLVVGTLLGSCVLLGGGCGEKVNLEQADRVEEVKPPATAGSLESLVGTSWRFDDLGMIVRFSDPPTCSLSNPENPGESGPAYWGYRDNGVISVSFLGTTKAGTWDGTKVVLSGETGVKVD